MDIKNTEKQPLLSENNRNNVGVDDTNTKLPDETNPETIAFKHRVLGVVLVILAGMSFTGSNVIQKFVIPEVTNWQLLFTRALVQTVLTGLTFLFMHFKFKSSKLIFWPSLTFWVNENRGQIREV